MSEEDLSQLKSDLRLSTEVDYIDSLVISVHKDLAEYYAGAVHGNYGTGFYNIDRRTKTLLRESDYFVEDYAAQLTKILQRRLLIGYKVKTLEELEEKEGISAVDLTPNDNCSIGPKGLQSLRDSSLCRRAGHDLRPLRGSTADPSPRLYALPLPPSLALPT